MSKFKAVTMMAVVVVLGLGVFGLQTSRAEYQAKDIVDTAVAAGQFKTLAAALTGSRTGGYPEGSRTVYRFRSDR